MLVVVKEEVAWVYVNGGRQGNVELSANTEGERVGAFLDDEDESKTLVEDFAAWRWNPPTLADFPEFDPDPELTRGPTPDPSIPVFGPVSGTITHN